MVYLSARRTVRLEVLILEGVSVWVYVWGGEVWLRSKEGLYLGYGGPGTVTLCSPEKNRRYGLEIRGRATRLLLLFEDQKPWVGEMGPGILAGTEGEDFLEEWEASLLPDMLEGEVRYVLGRTGQVYRRELQEKLGTWAWRVRRYLDEQYLDPNLCAEGLQEYFGVREYSLRQQFQREFKVSIHEYYTVKRLRHYLDRYRGVSPGKCYWLCGYHAESTFRYELNRHEVPYR